jgi:hypothetical protein
VVRADNPLAITRTDETIGLAWADVRAKLPAASPTQVRVRDLGSGREVASQVVDNDGNGTMDELIFQTTLGPSESKRFAIEAAAPAKPEKVRVYASHQDPRDDVGW